ncbi:Glycosyltransferase, catalytic subunit of cellulose synthase and poly-beta-1,6-N-acetylglucosamine synthase [Paenibacillus uliginis N3/975]|uniref:Glycosyltransferase, catalytic subunit of cellulose synthase and poly-beta-1,6-N-acetylglucosamine synthase n=1 Tax=Paenibacillus uliginis N3/975 TaxID=1313296 RepID=A0A1X7HL23_9BACL|nr:glycosyltransferase [Paenibacillus uliginis]SMF87748.1 Glycosyltransferase, catalytic subunit of cellulose synthase and poly-beta-1,6-N-acetylglucosamine synthase [Paenibacillus uliginis N3/975]
MVAIYYVMIVNVLYFAILLFSFMNIGSIFRRASFSKYNTLSGSELVPSVSLLVPSYNEELTIIENVRCLMTLNYPTYEVIVINDGSSDETLDVLIKEYGLQRISNPEFRGTINTKKVRGVYYNEQYPHLFVIDKENGGKADSLNAGINMSRYPLISSIDADSLLEKDALIRMARMYMENPEETVAVGGDVRIANGCVIENGAVKNVSLPRRMWPMFQSIEYLKAFLGGRIGWSHINGLIIVSGAFGLFRKDYVIAVGGYRGGYPGEDMNIIIKLHRYMLENKIRYRIAFCPEAVCWTQAPDSYHILSNQRKRWGRGNLKNMIENRDMVFNPKYKTMGMMTMPYNVIFEALNPYIRITGLLALIGYVLLDMTNWQILVVFGLVNLLSGYLLSVGALILEEMAFRRYNKLSDLVKMLLFSALKFVGYHQLGVLWRVQGHIQYLQNNNSWGTMTRQSWKDEKKAA